MQRKNSILKHNGMAMIMAIAVIVVIATIMALSMAMTAQTTKRTNDLYLYEQSILMSKSATEYALLQISEKDDIQQLEILQEIKKSLPLEKQRPLQEAEEKIANSIRQKISTTNSFDEKEEALRRISGNQPEQMRIIQNLDALDEKTKGEIIKKQIEKVEEKIQNANNSDYLQQLQERVRQEEEKGEASGEIIRVRERIEEKLEEMKKEEKRTRQSSSEINQSEPKNSLEMKETKEERTINLPVIENLQPLSEETDSQIINPAPRESVSPQVKKDILIDEQPIEEERPSSSLSVPQEKQRNRQSR